MADSVVNRLGRAVRYLAALAVATTVCAAVSFGIVRYITRDVTMVSHADERAVREATELRNHSRALAELSGQWFERASAGGESRALTMWLDKEFQPRLNDLRHRLVHVEYPGEAARSLLRAAESLGLSTASPSDMSRRRIAASAILQALSDAERRVGALGVNPDALPPPVPLPDNAPPD